MTTPAITGLSSDMPAGGYPAGTAHATVTATVALPPQGTIEFQASLQGYPLASTQLPLAVKPKIVVPTGATLSTLAWPKGTTRTACYEDWAAAFGMPMAAKAYLHSFPTSLAQDGQLKAMHDCTIKPIACYGGLNYADLSADQAAFRASLTFLGDTFGDTGGWLVFDQEPNNGEHRKESDPGWTPAAFTAVSQARYADAKAVLPGWPVLFCPSTGGGPAPVTAWYPGPAGCDGIAPDHYCGLKGSASAMPVFTAAANLVAADHLPAGVGWLEIGVSASLAQPQPTTVTQLITDAENFFIERKQAGEACAPFCWWNGPMPGAPARNTIWPEAVTPANNYLIPAWQNAVKAIAAA